MKKNVIQILINFFIININNEKYLVSVVFNKIGKTTHKLVYL